MVFAVFAVVVRGRDAFTAGNASDKLAIAADMCTTGLAASEARCRLRNSALGACCCIRTLSLVEATSRESACFTAIHAGDVPVVVKVITIAVLSECCLRFHVAANAAMDFLATRAHIRGATESRRMLRNPALFARCRTLIRSLVEAISRGGACCDALNAGDVLSVVEGLLAAYLRERTLG
jgi:hypothetical protein